MVLVFRPEEDVAALERIESRLSGRSKQMESPVKAATPNPLRVMTSLPVVTQAVGSYSENIVTANQMRSSCLEVNKC